MSSFDSFKKDSVKKIEKIIKDTPLELKQKYIDIADPSYARKPGGSRGEAEFFISEARWKASHITEGFTSKDEFKDDLKALFLKPALLTFEAVLHSGMFILKCMEVLAHLVAALVELFTKKPDDNRTMLERFNPFGDKAPVFELPIHDLENAGNAAIEAVESLVKLVVYPMVATIELYAQCGSFIAKCLFSIDENIGERFNAAADSISEAMPNVRFA